MQERSKLKIDLVENYILKLEKISFIQIWDNHNIQEVYIQSYLSYTCI